MSTVYLAEDLRNHHTVVALKESHTAGLSTAERAESLAWLTREAGLLSTLDHPGLPGLLAAFSEGDRHYVAMPFLRGGTLEERVEREGPQPEALVLAWGRELAELLGYLHSQDPPVIHRDLKPANILLHPDGSLALLDLGVARRVARDGPRVAPGTAVGTPGYAAPEQYQGLADERSDLYSLGATLHRLLTAYKPDDEAPFRHPPLRDLAPEAGPETEVLLAALLDLASARRVASATATLRLLDAAICATYERANRPVRRMYAEVLALLPTGLALSGLAYWWRYGLPSAGRGAYRTFDAVGDPLDVLLVFLPMLLPLLPLLRPQFRALARREPSAALHQRWTATLLICCWALPLLACLLNLYLPHWGTLTPVLGLSAFALSLYCATVALIGVLILRRALVKRQFLPHGPRWQYLLAIALIASWPASLLVRGPASLGFCYLTETQPNDRAPITGLSSLASDSQGDLFILDQDTLQERTPDGIYHMPLNRAQRYDPDAWAVGFHSLAVAGDGSIILGDPGDPRLRRVGRDPNSLQVVATLPGRGLPQYANLAAGPDGALYYNDPKGGAIYRVAHGLPVPIRPRPAVARWWPEGLALDPQGDMYTIDFSSTHGAVERIAPDGTVWVIASIPLTGFGDKRQVTLSRDDDGSLYAADGTWLVRIIPTETVEVLNSTDNIIQAVPVHQPAPGISYSFSSPPPPASVVVPGPSAGAGNPAVHCSL